MCAALSNYGRREAAHLVALLTAPDDDVAGRENELLEGEHDLPDGLVVQACRARSSAVDKLKNNTSKTPSNAL